MPERQSITLLGETEASTLYPLDMPAPEDQPIAGTIARSFRGAWYYNTKLEGEYRYKYSGGLGTYCAKHRSLAVYAAQADKTFFVWGGAAGDHVVTEAEVEARCGPDMIRHMISFYDHRTRRLGPPVILLDKWTSDCHDNPVLTLDAAGHIWVFCPSHGLWTSPSYILRSRRPYDVEHGFERILTTLFAYPQPWYIPGTGLVLVHTQYDDNRRWLATSRSADGRTWSRPQLRATVERGHYEVSESKAGRIISAFNYHPAEGGLERRTNLYVMQSDDGGMTWTTVTGARLKLPLTERENPARIRDYESERRLVYLKDIAIDSNGRPVILYLTSGGHESGPQNDPREWTTARWTGSQWEYRVITTSDSNYDTGSLYLSGDRSWRLIAPTGVGPQPGNPGGEVEIWTTTNGGTTWARTRRLTADSPRNHTYVRRPVNAHPDFRAMWADGDGRRPSVSRLYYLDADDAVRRMEP